MDAVKFIKEYRRMCTLNTCLECPLKEMECSITAQKANPEEIVDIVEKYSKDNPIKTRKSEFLKIFPNALSMKNGALTICPCYIDTHEYKMDGKYCISNNLDCDLCREKYWLEELD